MTKRQFALLLAGLTLALVVFGASLGRRHLYHSDEARFALLAQDILVRGDWLLPRLREQPYMNKPPLFIWLIALLSLPVGHVTDFTAQLPAALAAAGAVIGTAVIGARLWGAGAGGIAALILVTSVGFVHHAELVLTDMLLTCFIVLALYAFYTGVRDDSRPAMVVGYGCVGLAVLSKGPAGFLVLLPAAAAVFDRNGWRAWRKLFPPGGLVVLALLLLPFVVTYLTREAGQYVTAVWGSDYVAWVSSPTERPAPPSFPLPSVILGMLPWSVLLPLVLRDVASRWRSDEGTRWVFYWLGLLLLVFLLVPPKRTRYLLPLYPAVALLLARSIDGLRGRHLSPVWYRLTTVLWIGLSGLTLAALLGAGPAAAVRDLFTFVPESGPEVAVAVAVVIAGALAGGWLLGQHQMRPAAIVMAATAAILLIVDHVGYPARFNAAYDMPELAARTRAALGPTDQLITYQYGKLSLDFYLARSIPEVTDPDDLRRLMAGPARVLCIVEEQRLAFAEPSNWVVLDRVIVGRRPILLIANRST